MQPATRNKAVEEIVQLINDGIDKWVEAGKLIIQYSEKDPDFISELCDKGGVSEDVIDRFCQLGRGEIYPYLLLSDAPGVRALRRLPLSVQQRHWEHPVSLLLSENGKTSEIMMDIRAMTKLQAQQAFSMTGVRNAAQQRAWIEDYKLRNEVPVKRHNPPYRVVGNKVIFSEPCQLTARELAKLLAEME